MSICCGASNCSKKEQCMKYVNNYFEYHLNEVVQFTDWSTQGHGYISEGELFSKLDCGDLSDNYPYFKEITYKEDNV